MNQVKLKFKCEESWEKMSPSESGLYCKTCNKVVIDFSSRNLSELHELKKQTDEKLCGNFQALQVESPFGDWRDYLISMYRKFKFSEGKKMRSLVLLFFSLALFLTGCYRNVRGRISFDGAGKYKNKQGSMKINATDSVSNRR